MTSVVALLSLCVGALPPCPILNGPECRWAVANDFISGKKIVVSPDDTLVAVASESGVRVHTLATGAAVSVPSRAATTDSAFSSDGASLAVATEAGVGVISLSTGQELWFDQTGGKQVAVAFSPDRSRVASHHLSAGEVHIRDAATGAVLMTLKGPRAAAAALYYTPDGKKIICGGAQWTTLVHVWDASTGATLRQLSHSATVSGMAVSQDSQYLAVGTWGREFVIYRLSDYTPVQTVSTTFPPLAMSFSRDSSALLVAGHSKSYEIYSVASGSKQSSYTAAASITSAVSFLHNSNSFLTVADQYRRPLLLWEAKMPAGPVQLVAASGTQDVAGVPVAGAEVALPAGGMTLFAVPVSLQGLSTAHATRVAVGEKLRLSCASGSCGFVVAVYSCKPCADAANDFEAQMVAAGFSQLACAPSFSVTGGSGPYIMSAYHTSVASSNPVELEAVVHATQFVVAFQTGVTPPSCPPPPCMCVAAQ